MVGGGSSPLSLSQQKAAICSNATSMFMISSSCLPWAFLLLVLVFVFVYFFLLFKFWYSGFLFHLYMPNHLLFFFFFFPTIFFSTRNVSFSIASFTVCICSPSYSSPWMPIHLGYCLGPDWLPNFLKLFWSAANLCSHLECQYMHRFEIASNGQSEARELPRNSNQLEPIVFDNKLCQ